MNRSHLILRDLTNLELSRAKIISEFTTAEKDEIAVVNKPNFLIGAIGEFGIRKTLSEEVIQNLPTQSCEYWWDWHFSRFLSYWEVKSQPWWEDKIELVLQDNNSGSKTNFQTHFQSLDVLLIWSIKPDGDTVTPLALIDPIGIMQESYGMSNGNGIAASVRVLHERGHLVPLNDEWKNSKLLKL